MALPKFRAVLFDLDGTLLDSSEVASDAFLEAFRQSGGVGHAPIEELHARSGVPFEKICSDLNLSPLMPALFREASRRQNYRLRLFPFIQELINRLVMKGTLIGVITGKDRLRTIEIFDLLGLGTFVNALVTPDEPPKAKPSPEGVWWLCEELGVSVTECVLVGDSASDLQAGRLAGVSTIGCTWGVLSLEELRSLEPDSVAETVDELAQLLCVDLWSS